MLASARCKPRSGPAGMGRVGHGSVWLGEARRGKAMSGEAG